MKHPFYDDDQKVNLITEEVLAKGCQILQIWKHGETDQKHCAWLLQKALFKQDSKVLDIACGVGAVAKEMHKQRPDLWFVLQNISKSQLQKCPTLWPTYHGDMNTLHGAPTEYFDAAMVCYAIGHVDNLEEFFTNVARVLKPEGVLFIYDLCPLPGHEGWALEELSYRTYTTADLVKADAKMRRFRMVHEYELNPADFNLDQFAEVCGANMAREVQARTKPVAYRFTKLA